MKTPVARAYALAFGAAVQCLRGDQTQAEIANAIGACQVTLSRIESGRALPNAHIPLRLAQALDSSPMELDGIAAENFRRALKVAAATCGRKVTLERLLELANVRGLFLFLAGVVIHER